MISMFSTIHSDTTCCLWSHITNNLLYTWMNDANINLLIIDTRNSNDFNQSHIHNAINLSHSDIITKKLIDDQILVNELIIKNSEYYLDNEPKIVVYDHNSEHTNELNDDSYTIVLLKKLSFKFKSVSFLTGGFSHFQIKYPNLCDNNNNNNNSSTSTTKTKQQQQIHSNTENMSQYQNRLLQTTNLTALLHHHHRASSQSAYAPNSCSSTTTTNNNHHNTKHHIKAIVGNNIGSGASVKSNNINNCCENYGVQPNKEITELLPFLYLGSQDDALSEKTLKALNITYVLNVSEHCPKSDHISDSKFLRISINDSFCAKLLPHFENAFQFIEKCRKSNSNILIHCLAGISRSPALAIAYIMRHKSMSTDDAYTFVKSKRPTISPNLNFMGQLTEYEKQLSNSKTNTNNNNTQQASVPFSAISQLVTCTEPLIKISVNKVSSSRRNSQQQEIENTNTNQLFLKSTQKRPFLFECGKNQLATTNHSTTISQQLQSPSQALANFNFNSPIADKTINDMFLDAQNSTSTNDQNSCVSNNSNSTNTNNRYIPKSFTIDKLNMFNSSNSNNFNNDMTKVQFLTLTRQPSSSSIKRCATNDNYIEEEECVAKNKEKLISEDNSNDNNKPVLSSLNVKKPQLMRPTSIDLSRQTSTSSDCCTTQPNYHHLQLTSHQHHTSCSSTGSSSSSSSSTSFTYFSSSSSSCASSINSCISSSSSSSSNSSNESQTASNEPIKKFKLSPIEDKTLKISTLQSPNNDDSINNNETNKSKSSENLTDLSIIINRTRPLTTTTTTTANKQKLNLLIESKSSENLNDNSQQQQQQQQQQASLTSSKTSLHGSVEKMIEVS